MIIIVKILKELLVIHSALEATDKMMKLIIIEEIHPFILIRKYLHLIIYHIISNQYATELTITSSVCPL